MSAVALRPYVPADTKRCAEIFRASIEELAAEDYSDEQREAWAARADDEQAFGARLAGALTLLAMIDGAGQAGSPEYYTHPLYWAPFVIVGEGGAGR